MPQNMSLHAQITVPIVSKFRIHRLYELGMASEDNESTKMDTRITDTDRVKLENIKVSICIAFRVRSKLGILTTVNVKPSWSMCRNLLCSTTTASIPVRRLFSTAVDRQIRDPDTLYPQT